HSDAFTPYADFWDAVYSLPEDFPDSIPADRRFKFPPAHDEFVNAHRVDDLARVAHALLSTMLSWKPFSSKAWRCAAIDQMYGSGKTTVGLGLLPALAHKSVRNRLEALISGLEVSAAKDRLFASIPEASGVLEAGTPEPDPDPASVHGRLISASRQDL